MDWTRLTAKGQVTIPKAVRKLEGESVRLMVVSPLDLGYLRGVQAGLAEWGSDEDDVAFADL